MKKVKVSLFLGALSFGLILLCGLGVLMTSCYSWPSFCIGDNTGYISYDRNTRKLEVIWENHFKSATVIQDSMKVDSVK